VTDTDQTMSELELLQLERDSTASLLHEREAFTAHLERLLDHARAERDDVYRDVLQAEAEKIAMSNRLAYLENQLDRLERARKLYRSIPGGTILVRAVRRLLPTR
jgi:hypothetical protein